MNKNFFVVSEITRKILEDLKENNMADRLCYEAANYCFLHMSSSYDSVEAEDIVYFVVPDNETDYTDTVELKLYFRHTAFLRCHFKGNDSSQYFYISTYKETGYPCFVHVNDTFIQYGSGFLKGVLTQSSNLLEKIVC